MPIYEFECLDCKNRTSVFVRTVSSEVEAVCPSCGSKRLERLISRFGVAHSIGSVHARHTDPGASGYFNDPRNIGRKVESDFAKMGVEIPSQLRRTIDAARDGVMPGGTKDLKPNVSDI